MAGLFHLPQAPRSTADYIFAPNAGPGALIVTGDEQGSTYHSGPAPETPSKLFVDAKTAGDFTVTVQYGDTNSLDTVVLWATIATYNLVNIKSNAESDNTARPPHQFNVELIPANRLLRMNVTVNSGVAKDATIVLRVFRPLSG